MPTDAKRNRVAQSVQGQLETSRVLRTARLGLRPFHLEDAAAVFANWASDPKVTETLRWEAHSNIEVTRAVLQSWIDGYLYPHGFQWAIIPMRSDLCERVGEPVGSIGVVDWDSDAGSVEVGYALSARCWGKGVMTEALIAVLSFLLHNERVKSVRATCTKENYASARVMTKAGMQRMPALEPGHLLYEAAGNKWQPPQKPQH